MDKPHTTPPQEEPKRKRVDWESLKTFDNGIAVGMVVTIIIQFLIWLL